MYLLSPNRDVVLNYYVNCVRDINMNVTFEIKSRTFSFHPNKNLNEYQYSILSLYDLKVDMKVQYTDTTKNLMDISPLANVRT